MRRKYGKIINRTNGGKVIVKGTIRHKNEDSRKVTAIKRKRKVDGSLLKDTKAYKHKCNVRGRSPRIGRGPKISKRSNK